MSLRRPLVADTGEEDGVSLENILGPCDPLASLGDDSACDPADDLPDVEQILDAVQASSSAPRFAGQWIDRAGSVPIRKFAFVNPTPADQAVLQAAADGGPSPVAVDVSYTLQQLRAAEDLVVDLLEILDLPMMAFVDPETNRLTVKIGDTSIIPISTLTATLELLLTTAQLPVNLLAVSGGYVEPEVVGLRDTYPPHAGGLQIDIVKNGTSTGSSCTSGFSILNSAGGFMGLSAGHCASGVLDDEVWIGTDYLSHSGSNSYRGHSSINSDAMRYTIPGGKASRLILVGGTSSSPSYRKVKAPRYTMATLGKGDRVCFQGIASGNNNCANVKDADIAFSSGGKKWHHMFSMSHAPTHGDSGGPVYHVRADGTAKAAGIVALKGSGIMYFSQIGYALSDMDASLYSY